MGSTTSDEPPAELAAPGPRRAGPQDPALWGNRCQRADQLLDLLENAIHATQRVDVDIEAVPFIDPTVISALINARNTATTAGRQFAVINPTSKFRRG
ncbi:STAS domain-containing protein [Micromonospora sp. NPDC048930]|uniref:STAS domain-containing protein n=1 Tax=Micromonospora sp. NPDC048930 TaxID=3364261 RepID=UPI00371B4170